MSPGPSSYQPFPLTWPGSPLVLSIFFFPLEHFLCILPGFHLVEAWRFFSHPHPRVVTAALAFYFSITILPTTCITILTLLP